jgi:hypothetical protein
MSRITFHPSNEIELRSIPANTDRFKNWIFHGRTINRSDENENAEDSIDCTLESD